MNKWIEMFRQWVAPRPALKGVWRRRDGGYLVRGRAKDPSGKQRAVVRVVGTESATAARVELERLLDMIRAGRSEEPTPAPTAPCPIPDEPSRMLFAAYAASLFERKVREGRIRSEVGIEKWKIYLTRELVPAFGAMPVAELRRAHVLAWRDRLAERISSGKLAPTTANSWLAVLKTIITSFVVEHELERNPGLHVQPFDCSEHVTYTDEEPNSLTPDEVPAFLSATRRLYPQHYAFVVLLFSTGLRPSSLRPLRRRGPSADVDLKIGELRVRRSHTRAQKVMERTKTGKRQWIPLPPELVEVLRWHIDELDAQELEDGVPEDERSELLFPTAAGRLHSPSYLDKPFRRIAKAAGLRKVVTPRAGRRTFQDLARAAEVKDIVTRAVSGHATENMQRRYSTVSAGEMKAGLARVIELAKVREGLSEGSGKSGPKVVRKRAQK